MPFQKKLPFGEVIVLSQLRRPKQWNYSSDRSMVYRLSICIFQVPQTPQVKHVQTWPQHHSPKFNLLALLPTSAVNTTIHPAVWFPSPPPQPITNLVSFHPLNISWNPPSRFISALLAGATLWLQWALGTSAFVGSFDHKKYLKLCFMTVGIKKTSSKLDSLLYIHHYYIHIKILILR